MMLFRFDESRKIFTMLTMKEDLKTIDILEEQREGDY